MYKKSRNYILLIFFTILICYLILILCDWVIGKINLGNLNFITEAKKIELELKKENLKLKEEAKKKGFNNLYVPSFYDYDGPFFELSKNLNIAPVGSKPNDMAYYCNEGYGLITYKTDRYGLRNQDEKWDKKIETFFIGDSFAHGACVNEKDTIVSKYELYTGKNSLNLASSGNSPSHYSALSNIFIPIFKPKEVFIIFYANDKHAAYDSQLYDLYVSQNLSFFELSNNQIKLKSNYEKLFIKNKKENLAQNFISSKNYFEKKFPYFFIAFKSLKYRSSLPSIRKALSLTKSIKIIPSTIDFNYGEPSRKAIDITLKHCVKFNCKVTIVYIPASSFWKPQVGEKDFINFLSSYSNLKRINFINTSDIINTEKDSPDYAIKGGHLSPKGYEKVVKYILSKN